MGKVNIIKIYDVNFTHTKVLRKIKVHLLQKHRSLGIGSMPFFLVPNLFPCIFVSFNLKILLIVSQNTNFILFLEVFCK
jgi:hypothetical protein